MRTQQFGFYYRKSIIYGMRHKFLNLSHSVIVSVIASLSLIGVLLLIRALSTVLWSQEAAGWVQAVGSIAAIFGAFLLANVQHANDRKLQRENDESETQKKYEIIRGILVRVKTRVDAIERFRKRNEFQIAKEEYVAKLRATAPLIEALPAFEMPSSKILLLCLSVQGHIVDAADALDRERIAVINQEVRPEGADGEIFLLASLLEQGIDICGGAPTRRPKTPQYPIRRFASSVSP